MKMRVVVACGGKSPEREVSLNSGKAVAGALESIGYDVILADVLSIKDFLCKWNSYNADGVYIALHGGWGENGEFQNACKSFGIKFTGSGLESSLLAMNKYLSKLIFNNSGVPAAEGVLVRKGCMFDMEKLEKFFDRNKKIIVKPNCGGSTVGVTVVKDKELLYKAIETAWAVEDDALIEKFIEGDEFTVPVFEEKGELVALPIIQISPKVGFYDYKNKYTKGATEYICPAPVSEDLLTRMSEIAIRAHKSLGCNIYSRVDFRVDRNGDMYVLEINTAPGMTETSLVPKSAKEYGYEFPEFLHSVIKASFALER